MKILICVDVQNDFIDGRLGVDKDRKITDGIIKFVNCWISEGWDVYATKDTHFDDYMSSLEGKLLPVPHCIENTDGWKMPDELAKLIPQENVWEKPTFGCLYLMDHIGSLKTHEIEEIALVGFCTSICVISNAILLRAKLPNTRITIIENLCGDVDKESHESAIKVAKNCQILISQAMGF